MADKKISELTSASALAGTEVLPIVQSGETKKLALNAITTLGTIATGTWQGTQIANAYIATLSTAGKVANSATTATNANTASAIVARDVSGNFTAGTITAALTGNASTAAALQTARNINGVSFDGTANITVTATTSFVLTAGTYLTGGTFDGSSAVTFAVDATSANTASKIVARDASGNFSAGAVTASSIVVSGTTSLNGVAYTWPATVGTNGQFLATTGTGVLAWANAGGGGGGGTTTFPLTAGTYLTGGTFDGSTSVTFAVDGTSANTASKVVARDASGNFAASVITGTGFQLNTTTAATAAIGRFRWESTNGTAQIRLLGGNVDLDVGEDSVVRVLNDTGTAMTLGQVVYITGAAGQRPTVALANAVSEATSTNVIGLVAEGIANNQEGFVYATGIVKGLNTFAFNEGDLLYLSATTAGALTNVRPTQPNHGVRIGYVVRKNSGDGHVYLAVNNGYELEELHDVLITTPAANNMIRRNAGNTLWVNIAGPAGDVVGTTDSQTLTNKTISGASNTISNISAGTLTGATLAAGVTASSLTSVGTLVNLTVTNPITGSVTGNAGTATVLQTARNINGVSFNGSADVTVTAAAGTLTGATLASGVTASSLTSVGTLTALTMGGTINMADNVINRPRFTDYAETYTTPAISAGVLTLNLENGNVFRTTRNANITTLTISNPATTGNACSFTLIFDANGTSYTITWPAAVKWPGGTAPTITTTASRSDMFVFYTNNAGTTWYAMTAAQNFVTT
jgi:hypothetical protein